MKIGLSQRAYPALAGLLLVFGVLAMQLAVQLFDVGVLKSLQQRLEWLAYDVRLNASLPETSKPDPRIVIVDIDEKSLKAEGRWPWSREKIAQLVERLFADQAAVVAFDVLFAEPEANPAQRVLEQLPASGKQNLAPALRDMVQQLDADAKLAARLQGRDVVLGYIFRAELQESVGQLPPSLPVAGSGAWRDSMIPVLPGYSANLARLQQAAPYGGFFDAELDADGVLRRTALVKRHGDQLYGSLGLEAARAFYALDEVEVRIVPLGERWAVESLRLGRYDIPTDAEGRVMIPYRGRYPSFTYVSATDVLHGNAPKAALESAIVFVGTTAPGLLDLRSTPMQSAYPGVEVHANIMSGILDQRFPFQPAWAQGADFVLLLVLGLTLALLLPWMKPLRAVILSAALAAALIAFNIWLWRAQGLVMNVATPLVLLFMLTLLNMAWGFLVEARGRAELKGKFGQYVPPELVEEMNRNPQDFGFEGDSREMSILFCDIRNFTTISESLSANEVKDMLNRFFTPLTRIVFNRRGTIDKYVGDMMMAFWGAPLRDAEHARHALAAAFDMLAALQEIRVEFRALKLPEIDIGIGINSGVVNVGDMGSEFRRAYTVIGDAVNLASRLEGLTRFYGVRLIVGEHTQRAADDFMYRRIDRVRVKGKNEAVTIYEPLGRKREASAQVLEETARHEEALDHYLAQRWDEAETLFAELAARRPESVIYALYRERIRERRLLVTDAEWDGVYEQKNK